ncbi:MAG: hypothetical protein H0V07_02260 [Propionibacteriales bacterium]|nr:hypothetical protein [Propionibacteriales bacterium]
MAGDSHVVVQPLQRRDPPMLGDVMIRGRLATSDAGIVYAGQLVDQQVAVVVLNQGAETDSFGRARFGTAVAALVDDGVVVASDSSADIAPWVAVRAATWGDALAMAQRVLAPVTLDEVAPVGIVCGPDFRPHWYRRRGVGRLRVWPLPWPSVLSSAGRWTVVAAFGLMVAIAAIALWIATLVFDTQPPAPPPPTPAPITRPVPSTSGIPLPTQSPSIPPIV